MSSNTGMLQQIINLDQEVLLWIHRHLHGTVSNAIIPFLRKPLFWLPLYLILIGYFIRLWRVKAYIPILCLGVCVGVADFLSVHLFKNYFKRLRPCHSLDDVPGFDLLVNCGGQFGFISSHATNHMAMAVFLFLLTRKRWGRWSYLWIFWAILIGFAQVFVGVHYPLDVLVGFLFGGVIGLAFYQLMNNFFPAFTKKNEVT